MTAFLSNERSRRAPPLVIDADALNALAAKRALLKQTNKQTNNKPLFLIWLRTRKHSTYNSEFGLLIFLIGPFFFVGEQRIGLHCSLSDVF